MSKHHLHLCLEDDGQTLEVSAFSIDHVGGVQVGPIVCFQFDILSSPAPDFPSWVKDTLVQVIERL